MNDDDYALLINFLERFVEEHELSRGAKNHMRDACWIVKGQRDRARSPFCRACEWSGEEFGSRVLEGGKQVTCCPKCGEYEELVSFP